MRIDNRVLLPFAASISVVAFTAFMGWVLGFNWEGTRIFSAAAGVGGFFIGVAAMVIMFADERPMGHMTIGSKRED